MEKHVWKDKTELIIFSYNNTKQYGVLVIENNGDICPKFPFNNIADAEEWIERQYKRSS